MLLVAWLGVFAVRSFSFLNFYNISDDATLYLLFFLVLFLLGYFSGLFFFRQMKDSPHAVYSIKSVNSKANWLIFLSIVGMFLSLFKFFSLLGGFSFSLSDITELRFSRGRDDSYQKGQALHGIFAMILSGFPIITYIFKEFFYKEVSRGRRRAINLLFIFSIFVSLLSGGRWAAATSILVVYLASKIKVVITNPHKTSVDKCSVYRKEKVNSSLSKVVKLLLLMIVIYIFGVMFMHRVSSYGDGLALLDVLNNNLGGVSVPMGHEKFLTNNRYLIPLYFVISLFQYYIGHGIYQLDVLISADAPRNAPYLFCYQYYLFVMVLNKLGFGLISIDQILGEIPNPGVYFTLAGAYYLDFGFWGSGIAVFITSMLGAIFWCRFLKKKKFYDAYISILFLILVLFSPIVAITSTGVFPSMFALAFILVLFIPKRVGHVRSNKSN